MNTSPEECDAEGHICAHHMIEKISYQFSDLTPKPIQEELSNLEREGTSGCQQLLD